MMRFDRKNPLPDNDLDFSALRLFSRFRRYPGFSERDCFSIFAKDVRGLLSSAECGAIDFLENELSLVVVVTELPWDSDYFQKKMARLHVWKSARYSEHGCKEAIRAVLSLAEKSCGIHHVSMEVDIDDYEVMNAALFHGFELMDVRRAYFTNIMEVSEKNKRGLSCVRPYDDSDYQAVELLLESVSFETRYSRDKSLDSVRVQGIYRAWFDSMLRQAGREAYAVVYERFGKIVACGAIGELNFASYGIPKKIRTNSIVACTKEGTGAYGAILTRLTLDSLMTHDLIEAVVSLNNVAAVRALEGIRPNRSVTSLCLRYLS